MAALVSRSGRSVLAVCVCLVALTSVACGRDVGRDGPDLPTLTIHSPSADERSLGPLGPNMGLVFLYLAYYSADSEDPQPGLLDRWDHTPDYTEWTVHVREGLVWDDGVPVTAADVKFGLELWTHPDVGYEARWFDTISVLDSHTLRFTFPDPPAATVFVFDWMPMVLPKHLLETFVPGEVHSWPFWIQAVGNGPYRYVRHTPKIMTELEANPDYYRDPPKIPRVVLRYGGSALTELLSENVDFAGSVSAMDAIRLAADERFRIYHGIQYGGSVSILWNHRNPLFTDVDVRRALTMSIDRRELHQVLNYPDDLPIADVPIQRTHRVQGVVPDPLPFDPEGAARLFAGAGWVDTDGDGTLDRDGRDFEFTVITAGETAPQAVYVQDQFRRAGIRMEISTYDRTALRQRLGDPYDFDAAISKSHWIPQIGPESGTGHNSPELFGLLDAYRATNDIDRVEADRHLRGMWEIIGTEIPITYLHLGVRYRAAHRRVKGMQDDTPWRVEDLWIDDSER